MYRGTEDNDKELKERKSNLYGIGLRIVTGGEKREALMQQ